MFQCLPGLYIAVFDKYGLWAKYDPLTRFALMALARKNNPPSSRFGLRCLGLPMPLSCRDERCILSYLHWDRDETEEHLCGVTRGCFEWYPTSHRFSRKGDFDGLSRRLRPFLRLMCGDSRLGDKPSPNINSAPALCRFIRSFHIISSLSY